MREHVVFIHSTGTGPFLFDRAAPAEWFDSDLVRIAPANLGYPPGAPIPRGQPLTVLDDAAQVLRAIPDSAERIHLVAHSYGGLIAQKLFAPLRGRLASVWLNEPVLFGALKAEDSAFDETSLAEAESFTREPRFLQDDAFGGGDEWLHRFIDYWNAEGAWRQMGGAGRAYAQRLGWKMYQEVRCVFGDREPRSAYQLDVPLTLVIGERTTALSHAMTRAMARINPHAKVERLPGVGHMALLSAGGSLRPSIKSHLDAHRLKARSPG